MTSEREFDIVLWGATGFTGRLVAERLAAASQSEGLRWAIAGRNRGKLAAVASTLTLGKEVGILTGDSRDAASLEAIAERCHVVCSTVGPYALYGSELVAACIAKGTHYCDLTGEVPWIRKMIDAHHEEAEASGTRIVHCCGFDSIPSDLGTYMMHEAMSERGEELARVDAFARTKGGFSGGTVASMLHMMDAVKEDRSIRRVLGNPYALDPKDGQGGPDAGDANGVSYEKRLGVWTAPFIMAGINTRVVRRSNAVMAYAYGQDFRYSERMDLGRSAKGLTRSLMITGGLMGFLGATQVPALRAWLEKKLPGPGDGPSESERNAGYFSFRLLAESKAGRKLSGKVAHDKDPGYGSTAVMLSQAALCLAKDDLSSPGGILTPASAMGRPLIERLRGAGLTLEVAEA